MVDAAARAAVASQSDARKEIVAAIKKITGTTADYLAVQARIQGSSAERAGFRRNAKKTGDTAQRHIPGILYLVFQFVRLRALCMILDSDRRAGICCTVCTSAEDGQP